MITLTASVEEFETFPYNPYLMSMVTRAAGLTVHYVMPRKSAQSGKKWALIPGGIHHKECLEESSGREGLPTVYGDGFMSAAMHTSTSKRYHSGNTGSTCNGAEISSRPWGK